MEDKPDMVECAVEARVDMKCKVKGDRQTEEGKVVPMVEETEVEGPYYIDRG